MERFVLIGERSLRRAVGEFVAHTTMSGIIKGWGTS